MSRRKKSDLEPLEAETAQETAASEVASGPEDEPENALDAEQEEAAELDAVENAEEAPAAPKKASRKRASKSAKATPAAPLLSMAKKDVKLSPSLSPGDEEAVEKALDDEGEEDPIELEGEQPTKGKGSRLDVQMKKNVALAATTAKKSVESMEKQWEAIQEISQGICANLEKVQGLMKEIPSTFSSSMQELLKPPATKSSPLTKIATGASVIAIVLSLLSLSLSQTARQVAISSQVAALSSAPKIAAPLPLLERPRIAAPEIAARPEAKPRNVGHSFWSPKANFRSRK